MTTTIAQVARFLESLAPLAYQESYDNSGLLVGDPQVPVRGILVALDATEAVVDEALARGCNLVVAHHPIVFSGLKKLTGRNYVERTVIKAIQYGVGLYAIHTNLDHVLAGVNARLAGRLGLQNGQILAPKRGLLKKLTVFVPQANAEAVLAALAQAGAGQIGNYSHCSFTVPGQGTFMPNAQASPHLGQANVLERVAETRIEVVLPAHAEGPVLAAMRQAHPYEEVAYFLHELANENQTAGAGLVGYLPEPITEGEFLQHLKNQLQVAVVRHTPLRGHPVHKVAVCGGAGSFLLPQAVAARADFFVTADYKYHQFFDADSRLVIADVGHYESEIATVDLLVDQLLPAFANLPVLPTHTNTNPVQYFLG
jgi:dinuclear metal center YbgI/SA1388 family protein